MIKKNIVFLSIMTIISLIFTLMPVFAVRGDYNVPIELDTI